MYICLCSPLKDFDYKILHILTTVDRNPVIICLLYLDVGSLVYFLLILAFKLIIFS